MKNSIIVPTYNSFENREKTFKYLEPCLKSVVSNTNMSDNEIIVVANGCSQETLNVLISYSSKYNNFRFVWDSKPLGYSRSTNLGLKLARGENSILLNDDARILNTDWIDILSSGFDSDVVITGPLESDFHGHKFLIGFLLSVKSWFFNKFGFLDENLHPGFGEDIDLCLRAKKLGFDYKCVSDNNGTRDTYNLGSFPVFHEGEATYNLYPDLVKEGQKLHKVLLDRLKNGYYNNN